MNRISAVGQLNRRGLNPASAPPEVLLSKRRTPRFIFAGRTAWVPRWAGNASDLIFIVKLFIFENRKPVGFKTDRESLNNLSDTCT
jgi:hypothetical protein